VAGATAAERLREAEPEADIAVLTDEEEPLYNRIMLKSYMKGSLPKKYTRMHDEEWYEKREIDLRLGTRVEHIDTSENIAVTSSGERIGYGKALVATGGSPRKLPQDDGFENVHYMWTMSDASEIRRSAEEADRAVVVGGGLLGIDLAVAYAENGCETYYLIRGENWWSRGLDRRGGEIIHRKLEEKGVKVLTCTEVGTLYQRSGKVEKVELESEHEKHDGSWIEDVDAVAVAIGQTPNSSLVDVEKNDSGMIQVDENLQTSNPDLYAAGNMVEYESPVYGRPVVNGSWDHSEAMGECAAENMFGEDEEFDFINTYGVGHFDVQFLSVGMTFGEPELVKCEGDEYRREFYLNGSLVGAVMIGDVSGQEELKERIGRVE
jgi:NAD(P)H-nitrite reductase large subunit